MLHNAPPVSCDRSWYETWDGGAHEASYISARWSGVLPAESAARQAVGQLEAIKRMASARRKTGGRWSGVRPKLSCGRGAPSVSYRF